MEASGQDCVRKRQKQLFKQIRQQMEFYLGDANLQKDRYMKGLLSDDIQKWIPLEVFTNFNKLRQLSTDAELIGKALTKSSLLEVNAAGDAVRRTRGLAEPGNVDARTVYVESLPPDADHDWVRSAMSPYGAVAYISLPKYKTSGDIKGFAFVEFQEIESAQKAAKEFDICDGDDANKRPGWFPVSKQMKQLQKQATANNIPIPPPPSLAPPHPLPPSTLTEQAGSKRKAQEDEDDEGQVEKKKQKTEGPSNSQENITPPKKKSDETTKKNRKKKKKKVDVEPQHPLRVISKAEWMKLRQEYLDTQKANMKQLKKALQRTNKPKSDPGGVDGSAGSTTAATGTQFMPDVLLQVTSTQPMHRKTLKESLSPHGEIAYIELIEGDTTAMVRCAEAKYAASIAMATVDTYTCKRVEGDEEQTYWEKVASDREKKRNTKTRGNKRRGKDKIADQVPITAAATEPSKKKHVIFDDS